MKLEEYKQGVFYIKNIDENYPVLYIRLYKLNKEYCIPYICDLENQDREPTRQILVVGFKLPSIEGIHEQVFYKSTGQNSVDYIKTFYESYDPPFQIKSGDYRLWLPCIGLGYPSSIEKTKDPKTLCTGIALEKSPENDLELSRCYKVLKNFFDCTTYDPKSCLNGRFGSLNPSMITISYCLGGSFWKENESIFLNNGVLDRKLDSIERLLNKKTCDFRSIYKNPIDCCIDINNYIACALPYNYIPDLLTYRNRQILRLKKLIPELESLRFDFRIVQILFLENILRKSKISKYNNNIKLPVENIFHPGYWNDYIAAVYTVFSDNKKLYKERILPLILEQKEYENMIKI